jgi:drug/metabolite transporter (DMT)-like permease
MAIPYIFLVLAQFMVGISIVSTKYLAPSVPAFFLLTIRFALATIILLILHGCTQTSKETFKNLRSLNKRDWVFIVAQGLCAGVFFNVLMLWGLNYTSANVAGIITSVLPALIALMSWIILKQRFSAQKGLCILFASIGLIIIGYDELNASSVQNSMFGNIIIFCALLPEAAYYILSKVHGIRLPVFLISALLNGINTVCLIPLMALKLDWSVLQLSGFEWLILIILSIATGFFYVFWYMGSHKVDVIAASLSTALMPIATVLVAWLSLGEMINMMQLIGMIFVMISIVVYTFT